jgi:hypothetical protein
MNEQRGTGKIAETPDHARVRIVPASHWRKSRFGHEGFFRKRP